MKEDNDERMLTADDFLSKHICDLANVEKNALEAFRGSVCGELFVEYRENEVLRIENEVVQAPSLSFNQGFGLRTFQEDSCKYSYSSTIDIATVKNAVDVVKFSDGETSNGTLSVEIPSSDKVDVTTSASQNTLYNSNKFIDTVSLTEKIEFLKQIDAYARSKSDNIVQVMAILASSWQVVSILDESGTRHRDIRPLVRLTVSIILGKDGAFENGMASGGGRFGYENIITDAAKISYVDEAIRQAEVKLQAIKAPVGEMPVVLGNAWTGILLHEAVGHGLEGDAIRKKTSAFHNLLGEQIGSKGVTVIDDGTVAKRRGSLNIDDEGVSSQRNVLIEDGKLVGFMQDRMNAKLMGGNSTGNGRRQGYEYTPMPRMTNTFMQNGGASFDEMVAKVDKGIYAKTFSDGQVDITSGKFVFSASEAYLIENGKITAPVKGAMLIGDGPSILKKISMVGDDFSLDNGVGTCGKDGQWVPVGVGLPSLLIDKITVGGANI